MDHTQNLPGILEIMQLALRRLAPRYKRLLYLLLFSYCLSLPLNLWVESLPGYPDIIISKNEHLLSWAPHLYTSISLILLSSAIGIIARLIARSIIIGAEGQTFFQSLRYSLKMTLPFLWMTFLGLLVITPGFLLFLIPGLILLVDIWFADWILIEGKARGIAALVASAKLIKGRFWSVLWRIAVPTLVFSLGVGVVSGIVGGFFPDQGVVVKAVLAPLIVVILSPIIFTYDYVLYSILLKSTQSITAKSGDKTEFKVLAFIGLLIVSFFITITIWSVNFLQTIPAIEKTSDEQSYDGPVS